MSPHGPIRRIAVSLAQHAAHMLPKERSEWGRAMTTEVAYIENDVAAIRWSLGCALASYREMTRMNRLNFETSRGLLGLEASVCLGPLTLLWLIALYTMLSTQSGAASILVPILLGTLGPIALARALYIIALARPIPGTSFAVFALGFATLALLQTTSVATPWFAFDRRVWMLNSILPAVACAHLAFIGFGDRAQRETRAA
jgi:hypothetical protein